MPTLADPPPPDVVRSDEDWRLVRDLIRDLETRETRDRLVEQFHEWWSLVHAFRKIEFRRLRFSETSARDLHWHAQCLSALISVGERFWLEAEELGDTHILGQSGIMLAEIDARVAALKHNWSEWHAYVLPEQIEELRGRIFHVEAPSHR